MGWRVTVRNGGVSGGTTAGGRARLDWMLIPLPDAAILTTFKSHRIPVLLAGMMAPRNLGDDYVAAFDAIYPALARDFTVPLYPFFLDGVATEPALLQSDGLHPTASGV